MLRKTVTLYKHTTDPELAIVEKAGKPVTEKVSFDTFSGIGIVVAGEQGFGGAGYLAGALTQLEPLVNGLPAKVWTRYEAALLMPPKDMGAIAETLQSLYLDAFKDADPKEEAPDETK